MVSPWHRRARAPSTTGLLDAMAGQVVVLDTHGTVVAVNRSWVTFAGANGGSAAGSGIGSSYVAVCDRAAESGSLEAVRVAAAVRSIARGDSHSFSMTYRCPAPEGDLWFEARLSAIDDGARFVLVVHEDVTDRHVNEVRLERRASQDALTGLGNRVVLSLALTAALAQALVSPSGGGVGLVHVDLDDFKPVNDTYGHAVGDAVLQSVAARLRQVSRPGDTVARLGGDEFAICAPHMDADGLRGMTHRVTEELALPHRVRQLELGVTASVGGHLAARDERVAEAMERADQAMYAVKHAHRRASAELDGPWRLTAG